MHRLHRQSSVLVQARYVKPDASGAADVCFSCWGEENDLYRNSEQNRRNNSRDMVFAHLELSHSVDAECDEPGPTGSARSHRSTVDVTARLTKYDARSMRPRQVRTTFAK